MAEQESGAREPAEFGLDDAALAAHPTVYAADAFAGRTVLVSGGAGGIGRAAAWLLGRLGARVVLAGRNAEKLEGARTAMAAHGLYVRTAVVDIREPESVAALFARVAAEAGGIDMLINSAGGQFPQAAIDFSAKGWNTVINTNLNGTWHMMQAAARAWRDAGRAGSIVNIVVVTTHGLHGVAHTIAARAGVIGLSQALAVEWAPLDIRINCIAPGVIETPGWRVYDPKAVAAYPRSNPMMRNGSTWEVAEACAYLGGPAGGFVTGEVLHVAGGSQLWGETWTIEKPDYFRV
ncbi:short-chain dehydrogenase [Azorhizobium oxalatiphilum]|uniref:Peroxisomal trans-2-enoyl-CoA reductase n=1 Tax=Azorhizobium oxalatiphilum TaxID=980631 RepID=A0A917BPL3_9HYPH|nr:SDR family oxidoreductase [Azorhizobium oxalatiphilum]GGF52493.1 short-chain dehydrogenase [Azorhizobium oxalatiphilum]